MSKLLALDQSSKTSGYSIYDGEQLVTFGHFTCNQKDMGQRLVQIRDTIQAMINKYEIDKVIIEDIHQEENKTNNVQTFKVLAEVIGVIIELLTEMEIPYNLVAASVWKSGVGVSGRTRPEQKASAQHLVNTKFNLNPTEDEADAICIGLYWAKQNNTCQNNFDWSE